MHQLLSSLDEERERQFRRFVALSAALHVGLAILFWWSPLRPPVGTTLPAVVRVDLVTAAELSPAPAPKPAPKPVPVPVAKPPPPPPPPPQAKKVLPKQPAPLPKPKPKAEPKPRPEPPKAETKPKTEPKPPEPAPEQDYDDVLAELRKEAGETAPKPVETAQVPAPAAGGPAGPGQLVSPEVMRWIQDVKAHVTHAWILEAGFRMQPLVTLVVVDLGAGGEVLGTKIKQSSGNPWYDESVVRAIRKASPLPAPPRAGEWDFSFDAREL